MYTDNYILIEGGSYKKIKKALTDWIQMHSKDLNANATFQLFKNGKGKHIIKADKELDNEQFYYLVNYLKYPIDIEYDINVVGYTIGRQENQLHNKILQVYISERDIEGDNVYVATQENKNYKIDFGGKIMQIQDSVSFKNVIIPKLSESEILNNNSKKVRKQKDKIINTKIDKRFKFLSSAIVIVYLLLFVVLYLNWNTSFFVKSLWYLNLGVALWLFIDYKVLQNDVNYLWSVLIAASIIPYTWIAITEFGLNSFHSSMSGSLHAIVLLFIQWPLRRIYLNIFKIEPEVERTGNARDFAYTFFLVMGMSIIPIIIVDLLNK